ncbi:cupin domain-containing protein [Fulvimarina sp. MAC3]|uniref:cupin domain-containing protein n=1 Tax=Fulvimarina sp. MAC3 TaxID=3148887 RepID=UPI0031FCAAE8
MPEETENAPLAVTALQAPVRARPSNYPEPFRSRMRGRIKRPLGELFGLANFGVNLTVLEPGAVSALLHRHATQDEFVYVIEGTATLVTDDGEIEMMPGMCAGFPAKGRAHQVVNRSQSPVTYLEIGDRSPGDSAEYPDDDLVADWREGAWLFTHKDGTPY